MVAAVELHALDPHAGEAEIDAALERAEAEGIPAICVPPTQIVHALNTAHKRAQAIEVASVAGYPSGQHHSLIKAAEARFALQCGAKRIYLSVATADAADFNKALADIISVREAIPHPAQLGVIVDAAQLTKTAATTLTQAAEHAGADILLLKGEGELTTRLLVLHLTGDLAR